MLKNKTTYIVVEILFVGECLYLKGVELACREGMAMKENDKLLYKTMKTLLNEKLSDAEVQSLKDEGFNLKNPTRKTAVMIALYKKASSGELSAIKELRSIVAEKNDDKPQNNGKAVIIVDDISN